MRYRLLIFYGSSPGAGKSTLSSRLNQQLSVQNRSVDWLYEDDVLTLDHFAPVVECVQEGGGPGLLDACLTATKRLVDAHANSDTIVVTDSILPYYDWLLAANFEEPVLAEFSTQLWQILQPLKPLIIYLQADVETALKRAVAYRGEAWLERSIAFMNTWGANQSNPLHTLADVVAYDQRTDWAKQRLLSEWPGDVLWLDSVEQSLDKCIEILLDYLEVTHIANHKAAAQISVPAHYVGCFSSCDADPPRDQQTVTVSKVGDEFWVDLYWPNGCRLIAEDEHTFRLQDTSHWVEFVGQDGERSTRLQYHYRGTVYTYEK